MKRLFVPAALAAAAILVPAFAAPATAQSPDRAIPDSVDASTTPKRDRSRPYTFTTTGKVTPPPRYCAAGQKPPGPGQGGQNCVPILCPPGQADKRYCFQPGQGTVCSGTVTVRVQRRSSTISSRNVQLRPDCTYSSRVTFSTLSRTRRGVLNVRVRFQGNSVMMPRSSGVHQVRAG